MIELQSRFCLAISDIQSWIEVHLLNLNKNKTENLCGQQNPFEGYDSTIGTLDSHCPPFARNICVISDRGFRFDKQISSVVKTSFFHLRFHGKLKAYLP